MKSIRWMAAFLPLMSAAGCGGVTAPVSGKVTYQGEPVTSGYVVFYGADGRTDSGRLDGDGHYIVSKVPVGDVKVTVLTTDPTRKPPSGGLSKAKQRSKEPLEGAPKLDGPAPAGKFVAIPERYKDPDQSGLNFTVKSGSQTIDLELKP
jgi:hypothetical protein